ncbi:MAG: caspase family protein [Aequorivita sp.]
MKPIRNNTLRGKTSFLLFIFLFSLLTAIAQTEPILRLPIGHTYLVDSANFSPDGKRIVSASGDHTAKIWDAQTGILLADLTGHSAAVISAIFSPNGRMIVTASKDKTAKIWDAQTGKWLVDITGHSKEVSSAIFSPDGKKIVTASDDNTAKIWDAKTGKLLADITGHSKGIYSAIFSPDGKKIATASWDKTAKIWDAQTGKILADLTGHISSVNSAIFSPDGKKIVTASSDNTAKIWDAKTGKLLADLEGHSYNVNSAIFSPNGKMIMTASWENTAKIWDAKTGKLLSDLTGHSSWVNLASFSPDSEKIVTASLDHTAKIWDAKTGTLLSDLTGHSDVVNSAIFSLDGKKIVTASQDNTAKIWDVQTGTLLADLSGHSDRVYSAIFCPDGKKIVTGSGDNAAKIWDTQTGSLLSNLVGHSDRIFSTNFSPDGKKIITVSDDKTAKIWDAQTGTLLVDIVGHSSMLESAMFSPDGKKVVTASWDKTAKIWDTQTGTLLADLAGHSRWVNSAKFSSNGKMIVTASMDDSAKVWDTKTGKLLIDLVGHSDFVNSAVFSPDDKKIVTVSADSTAKIWDAHSGTLLVDIIGHSSLLESAIFSPDGKKIVTASRDNTAKIWDVQTGTLLADLVGHSNWVNSASFSPNGKKIVTASMDNTAKIWDVQTGTLLADLVGHSNWVNSASFGPNSKKIVTASMDNTSKIWDVETGKILYTFLAVENTGYLVYDEHYHYDGTEAARKLLYFTCGTEIIELDQVKDQLWVPGIVERINRGEEINAKTLADLNLCDLLPLTESLEETPTEYRFKITERRGGLGKTVLMVNEIEVKRYQKNVLNKSGNDYILVIPKKDVEVFFVTGTINTVAIKSYTTDNTIPSRGAIATNLGKTKTNTQTPNLFAVMVGVSQYKGDELTLKYAAKDAQDLSSAIKKSAGKLLNTDGKEHVFVYNLTTEKEHYLLPEKAAIKKTLEEIGQKAGPDDILLIFFAGHGVVDPTNKLFYFLTADASKATVDNAVWDVGISLDELAEWTKPQNIKAQKRILIFDACNSGQAINDLVQIGGKEQNYLAARNDDKGQQIKAIENLNSKSGLFILSASATNQSAYEMGRFSQGVLTYSLLKTIREQPGILEDGKYLNVGQWFNAAEKEVQKIAEENGLMQEPQKVTTTNFNIGIVDQDVINSIVLPTQKALFSNCNLQNSDEDIFADDLGLSKLIDQNLLNISTRGNGTISFVANTNTPDAHTISGRYEVIGNTITVKINIRQSNETKSRFEMTGSKDKLTELAEAISTKAELLVK